MSEEELAILKKYGLTEKQYNDWLALTEDERATGTPQGVRGKARGAFSEIQAGAGVVVAGQNTSPVTSEQAAVDVATALAAKDEALNKLVDARRDPAVSESADDRAVIVAYYEEHGIPTGVEDPSDEQIQSWVDEEIMRESSIFGDEEDERNKWLDYNVAWINSGEAGIIGRWGDEEWLDINVYAPMMHETLVTAEDLIFTGEGAERNTDEENRIIGTKLWFANKNQGTELIVRSYGDLNGMYMSKEDQDAFHLYDAVDGALTFPQSKALVASATSAGLDSSMAWLIYSTAKAQGLNLSLPWTGKSAASLAADAEWSRRNSTTGIDVNAAGEPVGSSSDRNAAGDLVGSAAAQAAPGLQGPPVPLDYGQIGMWGEGLTTGQIEGELTPGMLWGKYNAAFEQYGSELVAMVALSSVDLAGRLHADPYSLTGEEMLEVDRLIGGYSQWMDMPGTGAQASWIRDRLSGASSTVRVDSAGAMEAARTLAANWNMPTLSDGLLRRIATGQEQSSLSAIKAQLGNPFQPSLGGPVAVEMPSDHAAAARALRGTAEYGSLFANMRSGESEEQYAQRFDAAVSRFMMDSDPELARTGMRSGSPLTVGQNAMFTGDAFDNSAFMGRLTRLGNAFKEAT